MRARGRSIWLADMINAKGYERGVEVGAAIGLTTEHVMISCPKLKRYYVADDWRQVGGGGIFDKPNMKQVFLHKVGHDSRIKILEGISWEMADKVKDKSLDFCFIDASHDYESVVKDLKAWVPKVKLGGVISGHDEHWEGVRQALCEIFPGYKRTGVDNVWFTKKLW